jgi:lipid-A-disaccharide synthase
VPTLKVAIIAGEASGDILGAGLIQALKQRYTDIEFYGIGGDLMLAQGLISKAPMEQLSVMGFVEVLGRLPSLLLLRRQLIDEFIKNTPHVFIGIDAPDFNLTIELALKNAGILTVHYVSPSVWAWKPKRIYKIKKAADLLLTLFPFEQKYYLKTAQKLAFVGHPLAEVIDQNYQTTDAKTELGFSHQTKVVAILPGSRSSETKYLLPLFLKTAGLLLEKHPKVEFVIPASNQYRYDEIADSLKVATKLPVTVLMKQSRTAMAAADAILIASGTATLEAALLGKPMVVAYKMATFTHVIYSRIIKAKFISLPNLLANEMLVPELIQDRASPEQLLIELDKALTDQTRCDYQKKKFREIFIQLNLPANELAAKSVADLLASSN